jgi:ATP-dependent Clp protease ATP-binding subunit ClpA
LKTVAAARSSARVAGEDTGEAVIELYTDRALRAMVLAGEEAAAAGARRIEPEHLLLGLLRDAAEPAFEGRSPEQDARPHEPEPIAITALRGLGVDPRELEARLRQGSSPRPPTVPAPTRMSRQLKRATARALLEGRLLGDNYLGTEHLLLGVLWVPRSSAAGALAACGVDRRSVLRDAVRDVEPQRSELKRWATGLAERNVSFREAAALLERR